MNFKEFMHRPNENLDQLAEEAERKRTIDEEEKVDLETYIKEKIQMLREEFKIRLTKSEIQHMKSLKTEIAVDNYCRSLFDRM